MLTTIVIVFALVYLGMILGGLHFVQLDRTGVALLGAIVLIVVGAAERRGIKVDWMHHARIGIPVTIATLAITAAYLFFRI